MFYLELSILVVFSAGYVPAQTKVNCQEPRPDIKSCLVQGTVCGYLKDTYIIPYSSGCYACHNTEIQYYVAGICPTPDNNCNYRPLGCLDQLDCRDQVYVCATRSDNSKFTESCTCVACANPDVISWVEGSCPSSTPGIQCIPVDRIKNCNTEQKVTCGYISETVYLEYPNYCFACRDPNVISYVEDVCPPPPPDPATPPGPSCETRPKVCVSQTPQLVCATTTLDTFREFSNPCEACKSTEVVKWQPGPCKGSCSQTRPLYCTNEQSYTCGYFNSQGTSGNQYLNSCYACQDQRINYWEVGQCIFNKPVTPPKPPTPHSLYGGYCNNGQEQEICPQAIYGNGVCGYFDNERHCGYKYRSPCVACQDPKVIYWVTGNCNLVELPKPNNQGLCSYLRPDRHSCARKSFVKVCGKFNKNVQCQRQSCAKSQNYGNSCYACSDPNVEFWYEGDCNNPPQHQCQPQSEP